MVDKCKFYGKVRSAGYTQKSLAAELTRNGIKMSENTLSNKVNGKTKFNTNEVIGICNILDNISDVEKVEIFLS